MYDQQSMTGSVGPATPQHPASSNYNSTYNQKTSSLYSQSCPSVPEPHMKRDKDAIYGHPVFPLLALIFEKCELATCTTRQPGSSSDACSLESFNDDIRVFASQAKSDTSFYSGNPELDNLMVQAIQVLRFHLLEIEKVHELCDNFCQRYISCLKSKIPIDLVVDERDSDIPDTYRPPTADRTQAHNGLPLQDYNSHHDQQSATYPSAAPRDPPYKGRHEDTGSCSSESSHRVPGLTQSNALLYSTDNSEQGDYADASIPSDDDISLDDDDTGSNSSYRQRRKNKRGIFPKSATSVLRTWLFQNLSHPYPSEEQKKQLAQDSGLNMLQVNNWFINARRRIVQPMIDQSNRTGGPMSFSPDVNSMPGYIDPQQMHIAASRAAMLSGHDVEMFGSAMSQNPYLRSPALVPMSAHYPHPMMMMLPHPAASTTPTHHHGNGGMTSPPSQNPVHSSSPMSAIDRPADMHHRYIQPMGEG